MDLTESQFETLMALGARRQAAGQHETALAARHDAFWLAASEENTVAQARALRDGSTSHAKLGQLNLALAGAQASVNLLGHANTVPERRELAASYANLGRVAGLKLIDDETALGQMAMSYTPASNLATAWGILREVEKEQPRHWPRSIDQYRINLAGRFAAVEALSGGKRRVHAARLGIQAVGLALMSESGLIETSNHNLLPAERFKTKARHLGIALRSLLVTVIPSRRKALQLTRSIL